MWEVGYAMALRKPIIIITQDAAELPFDIHDMETLRYQREHLSASLGTPLRRTVIDTVSHLLAAQPNVEPNPSTDQKHFVGDLLTEIRELKGMVNQAVQLWNVPAADAPEQEVRKSSLSALEGAWYNPDSDTYIYAKIIDTELVAPYCYGGDDTLTSVYYGWRDTGEFFFARFLWLDRNISGFAFYKMKSVDTVEGAWWSNDADCAVPTQPDFGSGVSTRWERLRNTRTPQWASSFFKDVEREGIVNRLARARQ